MVNVGDSVMFSEAGYRVMLNIVKISKDGMHLLIVDEKGVLHENTIYNMTVAQKGGMIAGTGAVVKIRKPKLSGMERNGRLVEYIVRVLRPFEAAQTRGACRLDCNFLATLILYDNNNFSNPHSHSVHVTNISTGGARINTSVMPGKNDVCHVQARLNTGDLNLLAVVIASEEFVSADSDYKYVTRVRFTHLTEQDTESISRFIFDEFRKERRKQLQRNADATAESSEKPSGKTR